MATATLDSSKTNRRFIILAVVLGLLGAILVYATFSRDSGSGSRSGGAETPVVVAKSDIAARTRITLDMLEVKLVPASAVSELTFSDPTKVVNQITRFPIVANEQVLSSKIVPTSGGSGVSRALSYTVPKGKRAMAIQASEIAMVGGLVLPGDYVDILVVYDVEGPKTKADAYLVHTLLQNVEILAISQTIFDTVPNAEVDANGQRPRNTEAAPLPGAATVTVAVSPEDAQKLFLAESNGTIRLLLRAYGDGTQKPIEFLIENDLLPDNFPLPQ